MPDKRIINEEVLEKLVNAPSPTGYEEPAQEIVREEMKDVTDKVTTDVMGNVIAVLNPEGKPKIMICGHVDEVGMQVKYINKKGFSILCLRLRNLATAVLFLASTNN